MNLPWDQYASYQLAPAYRGRYKGRLRISRLYRYERAEGAVATGSIQAVRAAKRLLVTGS